MLTIDINLVSEEKYLSLLKENSSMHSVAHVGD